MYYKKEAGEVIKELNSDINGLTSKEVENRIKKYGKNKIQKLKKISSLKIFIRQFKNFIIYILMAAGILAFVLNEKVDAVIIFIIIVLNSLLGFFQEFKAEKAIESLRKLSSPTAIVMRDKKTMSIDSSELVPGDIIILEEGSYVPADARLIEVSSLAVDESTLTGESSTINKNIEIILKDTIVSNKKNMVFAGTMVSRGRGKAVVVFTGLNTELGKIAKEIQLTDEKETTLQKKIHKLGIYITISILFISGVIFFLNFLRGGPFIDSILTAIALAVAAIPEGLPAVITITLAISTQRMVKKNALIRRLSAVESLGSVTVICADKTGTITRNEMTVKKLYTNKKIIDVTGNGYEIKGDFIYKNKKINNEELKKIMEIASLCNNSQIEGPADPTEKAILVASLKSGYKEKYPRLKEIPFSSETKFMTTINKIDDKLYYHMKGAPEIILKRCNKILLNGRELKISKKEIIEIEKTYRQMASESLRVIGFAYSLDDKNYTFVGLMGMLDPPRKEVKDAIALCKKAGIKVIMITGDYEQTAKAVAEKIGIEGDIISGEELDKISSKELLDRIDKINIYARVSPQHKVKILQALKSKGHIVAMTGDGVNDAVALKNSDVGTAVGSGTDVAKEASDIILLDDNFTSIVSAIEEGRGIYNNIKRFIGYLFSCNLAEVLVIFLSLIIGLPLPLIAIQILWMNLLTDGLPALALGLDKVKRDVMLNKPRNPKENILAKKDILFMLIQASVMTIFTVGLFMFYLKDNSINYAQTVAFSTLVIMQLFNAINYHVGGLSILKSNIFSNKYLIYSIILSFLLQIFIVYIISDIFKTTPLLGFEWLVIGIAAVSVIIIQEVAKLFVDLDY